MAALSPPRPSKAQARWKLLRQAILPSTSSPSGAASSSSSLPHTGGIRTYALPLPCPSSSSTSTPPLTLRFPTPSPPSSSAPTSSSSSLAALVSHRPEHAGVDNTGNIQVWPAEEALLTMLLKGGPFSTSWLPSGNDKLTGTRNRACRILELGAGCTGLVGLGLAMAWGGVSTSDDPSPSSYFTSACFSSSSSGNITTPTSPPSTTTAAPFEPNPPHATPSMYVCLTDGHPDCVSSLHKSLSLNQAQLPPGIKVEVQRLVWKEEEQKICKPFDLIVAADVVFFERFHRALIHTLRAHVNPEGGEVWLLQPSRGGSLERFVALVKEEGELEVEWEGERSGGKAGGVNDDVGSTQLQLLKLRRMGQN